MEERGRSEGRVYGSRTARVVVAVVFLGTAACASSTSPSSPAAQQSPATASPSSSSFSSTGTATASSSADGDGVEIEREDSAYGEILTDGDGATLYVLTDDGDGQSTCTGDCAVAWPPVLAGSGFEADPEVAPLLTSFTRDDGSEQLAIDGRPLYTFSGDQAEGDTNGQGVNDVWFVVSATGQPQEGNDPPRGY
jgi:predicted lipoprotein with Yx(FWY)xxD motif